MTQTTDLTTLLERLAGSGVKFVLVGGLAAVAQGAPVTTFEAEIVHERSSENVDRLLAFLAQVGARGLGRSGSSLPPDRAALLGPGHSLFATDLGALNVSGASEEGLTYGELIPQSVAVDLDAGAFQVLSLEVILRLKRASTQARDKLVVPILEATLRRRAARPARSWRP